MLIRPQDKDGGGGRDYMGTFRSARSHVHKVLAGSPSEAMREKMLRFVQSAPCDDLPRQRAAARGARGDLRRGVDRRGQRAAVHRAGRPACARRPPARRRRRRRGSAATWSLASTCCWASAWATSRWAAARRRSRRARRSGCGSRPSCARASSVSSTCSTSPRPGCTPPTPSRCSRCSTSSRRPGNTLFVVEHDMDVVRRADWVVDIGPGAGEGGGRVLYSGPIAGPRAGRGVSHQRAPVRPGRARSSASRDRRRAGCTSAASRGTTSATSRSTCRWVR